MPTRFHENAPLYAQIRKRLLNRLNQGEWPPGQLIPGALELASEYNVSPGTVRKAIDSLVDKKLLIRMQGKGTYVSSHDTGKELFHFFHLLDNKGRRQLPASKVLALRTTAASRNELVQLDLAANEKIIRIERLRYLDGNPVILETVAVACKRFDRIARLPKDEIPNALYALYESEFGVMITRAEEKLTAVNAGKHQARLLSIHTGDALLCIERTAFDLEDSPVEYRKSLCVSKNHFYQSTIL